VMSMSFPLRASKTQGIGKTSFAVMTAAYDPLRCPIRALGAYLIEKFTIYGHCFPDPRNKEEWQSAAIFPGEILFQLGHDIADDISFRLVQSCKPGRKL
jgi:hypothetical protein